MKQIYPASITGKGSRFAEGGSVLDHAFGKSDAYTLGVEEEYMLLDAETFDLVQHIDTVLAAVSGHELEPRINPELMQSVLEVDDARLPHAGRRRRAAARAARLTSATSRASAACGSAPRARIRSRSSSGSASRRRTATARWSTGCSTSRAAS